ncbi:hypothetical protein [Prosthecobacter sp.]|uniref:hypothetical protein n=1 Tax=Prosthecobacter sp. TaxID=1965333 RepID=UPI003782FA2B
MHHPRRFLIILITSLLPALHTSLPAAEPPPSPSPSAFTPTRTLTEAIDQAHTELWRRFVDPHGIIRDYVGELPTPEDCKLGKPNAIGWWSPIENGPMFTGLYLPAMCGRARRSGSAEDAAQCRRLAQGLIKCASVSAVPGFIARGIGSDGTCHYPLSSDDQTHPWFLGLHAYLKSSIPTEAERQQIIAKVTEVATALEATHWRIPCEGAFKGQFRGGFTGHLFRDAVRYLYLLRALHDITGDPVWADRYHKALDERPDPAGKTRMEICALGYPFDRPAIANIDQSQLWIYVGCQASLAQLIAMETDPQGRAPASVIFYRQGLAANATNALPALEGRTHFDNNDTKVFGNANWRAVYSTWFPQPTQEDAARLAKISDKTKRGERKDYEARHMRNPLAAATLIALNHDDTTTRAAIQQTLRHYDYSKLNMAEFFLAECAYYALPEK